MEFLVKVTAPDSLRQKDILEDLRSGICFRGTEDPNDPYLIALQRVKLSVVAPKRTVKKLNRPIEKGADI